MRHSAQYPLVDPPNFESRPATRKRQGVNCAVRLGYVRRLNAYSSPRYHVPELHLNALQCFTSFTSIYICDQMLMSVVIRCSITI